MKTFAITRLALAEQKASRVWLVVLGLVLIVVLFSPALAPTETDLTLSAPARAQTAYVALLLFAGIGLPFVAAELGRQQVTRNHRAFWASAGTSDLAYFANLAASVWIQLGLACAACAAIIMVLAPGVVTFGALLQAIVLTFCAFASATPLAIGFAQRLSTSIAGLIGVAWNLLGIYGVTLFGYGREYAQNAPPQQALYEFLWTFLPHLRIGEQSERIVFGWPAIALMPFALAALYLASWIIVTGAIGCFVFRGKR